MNERRRRSDLRRRRICIRASCPGGTRSRGTRTRCACSSDAPWTWAALAVLHDRRRAGAAARAPPRRAAGRGPDAARGLRADLRGGRGGSRRGAVAQVRDARVSRAGSARSRRSSSRRSSRSRPKRSPPGGSPTSTCSTSDPGDGPFDDGDRRHLRDRHPRIAAGHVRAVSRAVRARASPRRVRGELECLRPQYDSAARCTPPPRWCCWGSASRRYGLGLVLALPLWAASSYAAWKDIFGIRDAPIMTA